MNYLISNFQENDASLSVLNDEFTTNELLKVVKKLKPNKSAGEDGIINEAIAKTFDKLKGFWCKLFNKILLSGNLPSDWLSGIIVPIYKNKEDKTNPGNYRGITLLSFSAKFFTAVMNERLRKFSDACEICSAKLFTAVMNERLRKFSDACEILLKNQAGFRPNHSTIDHIFVLKSLTDIIRNRKRKLFCAFVDYEKAFDKVWHTGLWIKMIKMGIGGKFMNVLINMY